MKEGNSAGISHEKTVSRLNRVLDIVTSTILPCTHLESMRGCNQGEVQVVDRRSDSLLVRGEADCIELAMM